MCLAETNMHTFLICTIASDLSQYAAMKSSLIESGFDTTHCRYQVFDNSQQNAHDPFQTINRVLKEAVEPYVVFCHQDIVPDRGHGYEQLVSQMERLNRFDPHWAVAGNAGHTVDLSYAAKITDPTGSYDTDGLPSGVCTLDENFLVIRTASGLHCSSTLTGFHLYATDLCLQAYLRGQSSYVLDFHLTHLSRGRPGSADFKKCLAEFKAQWNSHFLVFLVQTPSTRFILSRNALLRRWLSSEEALDWIVAHKREYRRLAKAHEIFRKSVWRPRPVAPGVET